MEFIRILLVIFVLYRVYRFFFKKKFVETNTENITMGTFFDIKFILEDYAILENGSVAISVNIGKYEDALEIIVPNNLSSFSFNKEIGFSIKKDGDGADQILKEISEGYKLPNNLSFTDKEIKGSIVALSDVNFNNVDEEIKYKLFFNEDDETEEGNTYAEMFLNVDLKNGTVEFAEKDMEYRENIIKAFSK